MTAKKSAPAKAAKPATPTKPTKTEDKTKAAKPAAKAVEAAKGKAGRKAWSRTATVEDTDACVDVATNKLNDEPDARRRWAYVCASILSSSNFLTY